MSEITFAAISATVVCGAIWLWVTVVRRRPMDRSMLLLAGVAAATVAGLTLIAVALPRGVEVAATAVTGAALAGILLLVWFQLRQRLDTDQARLLLFLGVMGLVFVFLGVILELRPRP